MNVTKKATYLVAIAFFFLALTSCVSQRNLDQYMYFQNTRDSLASALKETLIQPNDLLSIQVLSKSINQEQTALFNLFNVGISASNTTGGEKQLPIGYQVSTSGNIEVPLIGEVKAAGLTKRQLENTLAQKLASYVRDPMVNVRFLQYNINVLGEVKQPGIKSFPTDRVTIIDAISAAGDATDFARRDNVMVIREENGQRKHYVVNMSNSRALFASPAYQLQANDVVYVSPSKNKLRNISYNADTQRRVSLILGLVSAATFIGNLILNLNR
jgi:polysaccharide export outer membrane protein